MPASPFDALIVFAHGSRVPEANDAVRRVAEVAAEGSGFALWSEAFLELAEPTLAQATRALAEKGANYKEDPVVSDGKIVTGNGPEAAEAFANEVVKKLRE